MKVATIERIVRIQPIANTKLAYVFTTNQNYSICTIDEFNVRDKVVFIYKGALLPDIYNCQKYTRKGFVKGVCIQKHYSNGVIVQCTPNIVRYPPGYEVSYKIGITKYRGNGPKSLHPNFIQQLSGSYNEYKVDRNLFNDNLIKNTTHENSHTYQLDEIGTTLLVMWLCSPFYFLGSRFFN
jgi:hypothetical protein